MKAPGIADIDLPRFVKEDLARVTPKERVVPALAALAEAGEAFERGAYRKALARAQRAKELAPRDATVREMLGLAAYRSERWDVAVQELRTFRRLSGETTHLPVEMDLARILHRPDEVEARWQELRKHGGRPQVMKEGRVVYAAHLLDEGKARRAWEVSHPSKLAPDPDEYDLRTWYVAARAAVVLGDKETAVKLFTAIVSADPAFPGLDELQAEVK
jgi:tetratricopeptide (TPR) repeat protein